MCSVEDSRFSIRPVSSISELAPLAREGVWPGAKFSVSVRLSFSSCAMGLVSLPT